MAVYEQTTSGISSDQQLYIKKESKNWGNAKNIKTFSLGFESIKHDGILGRL